MKICLSCLTQIGEKSWQCLQCGWTPDIDGDVVLLAPHIYGVSEGYDPAWYEELACLEADNFWFVARNHLIHFLAKRYLPVHGNYLEVGCGTGFVLRMLQESFPDWRVCATEAQPEGIEFARKRVTTDVSFLQMDACSIPFRNEFDVIGAFDVVEHISDDVAAISQIYSALKPGGYFILSVPQHMFLWSKYDEAGCHFRRYSSAEIESKLSAAGFAIVASTSFNSLLLPLMMLSRSMKKNDADRQVDVLEELRLSPILNFGLSVVLKIELMLIRLGVSFPVGGSRMVVAHKPHLSK
jgi:SAM-dependent methyltransferase